jgi:uncharacterized membrane protein HdeD (DUF308 family)
MTYVLTAIGVILILAGVLALFFGDKQIPVRGGIVLKLFDRRVRPEDKDGDFSNWPYKCIVGGTLIVAGVLVLHSAKVV